MNTGIFWSALGVLVSILSAALAFATAIRAARKESKKAVESEVEDRATVNSQLGAISESIRQLADQVSRIADDLAEVKMKVAVHDDRFSRGPLRAVGGD